MNRRTKRSREKILTRINSKYTNKFKSIPEDEWPVSSGAERINVYRNNRFLVQVFKEEVSIRISVNRTELKADGLWSDDITWDDLQMIKRQIGYGDAMAVEVYPRDIDLINVANMRHLWLVGNDTNIGWKRTDKGVR